jgi:hypothetical protein
MTSKWTLGRTALILFSSFVGLLALTVALTYIPRDNDFRSLLSWLGWLVGFSFAVLMIPLLGSSLVVSIISIVKRRGRQEGIVALICNLLVFVGVMAWLLIK